MNTKLVIITLSFIYSITTFAQADVNRLVPSSDSIFNFGTYIIYPYKKKVAGMISTGGTTPDGRTWDGYKWDSLRINYDSTALLITGNQLIFKENAPADYDINTLRVIGKRYSELVFKDKDAIYFRNQKTDTRAYKEINDLIYQDAAGNFYFYNSFLQKILGSAKLDGPTLKHVMGYYLSDKNGLYHLSEQYNTELKENEFTVAKLISSENKNITPQVFERYFIYGDSVYSDKDQRLELDGKKTKEIIYSETMAILTDGNNFYDLSKCYCWFGLNKSEYPLNDFFKTHTPYEVPDWYKIPLSGYTGDSNLYIGPTDPKRAATHIDKYGLLLKTREGYIFLSHNNSNPVPQKIDKLLIYNINTRKIEKVNPDALKYIDGPFFSYKSRLYLFNYPVLDKVNVKKLRKLVIDGIPTNYITDGAVLIHSKTYGTITKNGIAYMYLNKKILKNIDIEHLKALSADWLADDKNLYMHGYAMPVSIPGLKIKICTIDKPHFADLGFINR